VANQCCAVCCDTLGSIAILFAAFSLADDCTGQPKSDQFMPECLIYSYPLSYISYYVLIFETDVR